MRLVDQFLEVTCLQEWSGDEYIDLASRVFEEYERDGVYSALSRFEGLRGFLRSRTLVAGVIVPTSTIVLAIPTILVTAPETALLSLCLPILVLILLGFTVSVILPVLLVGKMSARDLQGDAGEASPLQAVPDSASIPSEAALA